MILRRGYHPGEVEALLTRHGLGFASLEGRWAREIATSRELGIYRVEVWGRVRSFGASREMAAQPIIRGPRVRIPIP